jgi:hypothetical protein
MLKHCDANHAKEETLLKVPDCSALHSGGGVFITDRLATAAVIIFHWH